MNSDIPGWRTDFDREFTAARLALLLGALLLVSYPDIVFGTHAFFYRDTGLFGYPVAHYLRDCFWRGEVPLWNPYNNCGIPFLAQWNTLALYPPSLFYELLPMPWAMNFFILGHVFLAGIGMYLLAFRWFGNRLAASFAGLIFAWNGLALNCWMWPCHIAALGWMPWVVFLAERAWSGGRRQVVPAALAGACQMVTGSPEIILFTWLIVLGVFLAGFRRRQPVARGGTWRLAAVAALVAALSAAQLLPWLDLLAHGDRTSAAGDNTWAMPAWGAANFLLPLFRMTSSISGVWMQPGQEWTTSYYVGIVTLLLALLAVVKKRDATTVFLGLAALLGVLCAMGDSGLILKILKHLAPAVGLTRFPIKFVVLTIFCLPLLAASGIVWLQSTAAARVRTSLMVLKGIFALAVVVLVFCIPFAEDSRRVVVGNGAVRVFFLVAGAAAIRIQPRLTRKAGQLAAGFAFLLLSGLDVCTHVPRQNPTIPVRDYAAMTPPMNAVPRLGESRAMLGRDAQNLLDQLANPNLETHYLGQRSMLFSDCNLLDKIPKVNGFFSIHPREEAAVARLLYASNSLPRLEEFLGVSQSVVARISPFSLSWEPRTNFMPWAAIGQQPLFLDDAATLAALARPDFAPRSVVYLPPEAREQVSAKADATARILSSTIMAEKCAFQTQAGANTMLVMAQSYYHCWRASVDGKGVPLFCANGGFQAVEVPAGKHEVLLEYKDRAFQLGCAISLAALLLCAVTYFFRNVRDGRPS
jgi:hypothetical protein